MQEPLRKILNDCIEEQIQLWKQEGKTDAEICKLMENIDLTPPFKEITNIERAKSLEYLKAHMYEIALESKVETQAFITHMDNIWWRCFAASHTLYTIVLEAVQDYSNYIYQEPIRKEVIDKGYTLQVIKFIQGRALQIFLEILHLIRLGFADAAYARWRAMYELCCYGQFIVKQGEIIAKQYLDQSMTDLHKNDWLLGSVDNNGKVFTDKKGKNREPKFDEIQDVCGVSDAWKKEYKQACLVVHASPQGTFARLARPYGIEAVSVGHSDYGIAAPACQSAKSLVWITDTYLSIISDPDAMNNILKVKDWASYTVDLYDEIDQEAKAQNTSNDSIDQNGKDGEEKCQ
ncbi:MAG: hypothetical protein II889_05585 [Clostridia bacterium]|nr:hypothetical protein [Clostridia bacterium]